MNVKEEILDKMIEIKGLIMEVFHLRTIPDILLTFFLSIVGAVFGYFNMIVVENEKAFSALLFVLGLDWITGMVLAYKQKRFEARKAIKIVYYIAGYGLVLATVLSIESGYKYAGWMTEAVMLPIISFTLVGSLRKLSLLGIFPKGVLLEILSNIDNYKEKLAKAKEEAETPEPEITD